MLHITHLGTNHPLKFVKDYCETYSSLHNSYKRPETYNRFATYYPLSMAVRSGKNVVSLLLHAGAKINFVTYSEVGRHGDIPTMQLLLSCDDPDMTMIYNTLCSASYYGNLDIVRFLIRIPSVTFCNEPLCLACCRGHVPIIRLLLHAGADPRANCGEPLRNAARNNHISVVRLLLDNGAGLWKDEALRWAAGYGNVDIVRHFLDNGANPRQGKDGALRYACRYEHAEVVRILLEETDSWNPKALRWAVRRENVPIVRLLLSSNRRVYDKESLEIALEKDNKEIISLLQNHNSLKKIRKK